MSDVASSPSRPSIPSVCLVYGLLGLIPFLAPPVLALAWPGLSDLAGRGVALYGGLILSFLGGGRWGLALIAPAPDRRVIGLSMLPTLVGLALLLAPASARGLQLCALAAALAADGIWDIRSSAVPDWYPRLRALLTVGAVAGLGLGAIVLHG